MPTSLDELFRAASAARERAYAPYSGFAVGAAVLAESGRTYAGCNVENAAYPVGTCAEAGAVAAMALAGERRIAAVLVLGGGEALVTPCGGCRQRLREFATADTPVHVAGPEGVRRTFTLDELLPYSFGPENLALSSSLAGDRLPFAPDPNAPPSSPLAGEVPPQGTEGGGAGWGGRGASCTTPIPDPSPQGGGENARGGGEEGAPK